MEIGDTVLTAKPYAYVLSIAEIGTRCEQCFVSSLNLRRCSACAAVWYCNTTCQRAAWRIHKLECRCLKRMAPKIPTESALLMFRLVLRDKLGDSTSQVVEVFGQQRRFSDLMSHREDIKKDAKRTQEFLQICHTLKVFIGDDDLDLPSATELLEIFGKMVVNSFSICDGEMQPIGVGVYLSPSVLDHSCHPNAAAVFNGIHLEVRCVEAIGGEKSDKQDDKAPVLISYIDQLSSAAERRKKLLEQYYFLCDCTRCRDTHLDHEMDCIRCPNKDCDEPRMLGEDGSFGSCEECGQVAPSEEHARQAEEAIDNSKSLLEKVKQLRKEKDFQRILEECEECIQCSSCILHRQNLHMVLLHDRAFDAAIDLQQWETAAAHGELTIEPYKKYYPPYHPNVGVQLMKMGKLQLYRQQLVKALVSLQQAESLITVTHGKKHPLYQDLAQLLSQCAGEQRMAAETQDT